MHGRDGGVDIDVDSPRTYDPPAAPRMLGHDEGAVPADFDDREPDRGQVRDVPPVDETVPPGALRATLVDVAGDDA